MISIQRHENSPFFHTNILFLSNKIKYYLPIQICKLCSYLKYKIKKINFFPSLPVPSYKKWSITVIKILNPKKKIPMCHFILILFISYQLFKNKLFIIYKFII